MGADQTIPPQVDFVVEIGAGGLVKRRADGSVRFISPVPVPFNYGAVEGITGGDGDPQDAIELGPRAQVGARMRRDVVAVVRFIDAGEVDDKWICSNRPLSSVDWLRLRLFFGVYERVKRWSVPLRKTSGPTRFVTIESWTPGIESTKL